MPKKIKINFLLFTLFVILGFLFISPPLSNAGPNINELTPSVAGTAGYETVTVTDTTLSASVGKVIKGLLSLIGMLFLVLMVYAGFLWLTARGKEEQVEKAIKIFETSAIGLVIVVAAYSITAFVLVYVFEAAAPDGAVGSLTPHSGGFGSAIKKWWNAP